MPGQIREQQRGIVRTVEGTAFSPGNNPERPPTEAEQRALADIPESSPTGIVYCRKLDGRWVPATEVETPPDHMLRIQSEQHLSLEFQSSHPSGKVKTQRHGATPWQVHSGQSPLGHYLRVSKGDMKQEPEPAKPTVQPRVIQRS
jgi:hypothetical protein